MNEYVPMNTHAIHAMTCILVSWIILLYTVWLHYFIDYGNMAMFVICYVIGDLRDATCFCLHRPFNIKHQGMCINVSALPRVC